MYQRCHMHVEKRWFPVRAYHGEPAFIVYAGGSAPSSHPG